MLISNVVPRSEINEVLRDVERNSSVLESLSGEAECDLAHEANLLARQLRKATIGGENYYVVHDVLSLQIKGAYPFTCSRLLKAGSDLLGVNQSRDGTVVEAQLLAKFKSKGHWIYYAITPVQLIDLSNTEVIPSVNKFFIHKPMRVTPR